MGLSPVSGFADNFLGPPGSIRRPLLFVAIALIISSIIAPSFFTSRNLIALLVSSSFLVVLAVGESVVVLLGMIDLGVESMMASGGMLVAYLAVFDGITGPVSVLIGLLFGALSGLVVGLLVTKGRIPSFIVTLGTYWGLKGVALLFNGGNYISPSSVTPTRAFGFDGVAAKTLGIPNLLLITLAVVIVVQLLLSWTPLGIWIKSIGSNEAAARTVGLNTDRLKILGFVVSGILAVLAGVMITAWQESIYPLSAEGYSLQAIASVILGGIPFTGGRGTVVGAALGALIIGLIDDLIVLLGLPSLYEYIFVALILVVAGLQARSTKGFVK
jgi:ribose/xylose/arabinose/galactoside ABC-type transport system permease subunit